MHTVNDVPDGPSPCGEEKSRLAHPLCVHTQLSQWHRHCRAILRTTGPGPAPNRCKKRMCFLVNRSCTPQARHRSRKARELCEPARKNFGFWRSGWPISLKQRTAHDTAPATRKDTNGDVPLSAAASHCARSSPLPVARQLDPAACCTTTGDVQHSASREQSCASLVSCPPKG